MNKITKAFLEAPLSVLFPDGWTRTDNDLCEYVEKDGVKIYLNDFKSLREQAEFAENHEVMREWITKHEVIKSDETALEFCFGNWGKVFEDTVETCLEVIEKRVKKPSSEWLSLWFYDSEPCLANALHDMFPEEKIDWELVSDRTLEIIEKHLYSDEIMDFFTSEYLGHLAWMESRKDQVKEFLCNMDHEELMELFKEVTHMKVKKEVND
jgi:hypothetical protein